MSSPKAQKIDLNAEYPCPCGRRGRLLPITLTEAFGCNKCQQIFVLEDNGQAIEQLSTTYPYKKAWLWTGSRWLRAHSGFKHYYLPLTVIFLLICLVLGLLLLAQRPSAGFYLILLVLLALSIITVPPLMWWLAQRR